MSHSRDSSPVFYREIQKNAYLKRMPDEVPSSKSLGLRPLGLNKKAPLKPLWTQLCVHNGRTPYLEQYRDPVSARAHRPVWRASLAQARHVTASVTPRDSQHDFLVDTQQGPVRMMAPDWDTMQDWVTTLRNKLHELKIVPLCENVYCAPPAAAPPRAAARDPTSPLPPTPPLPPDRVPGIDLTPIIRSNAVQTTTNNQQQPETTESQQLATTTANATSSINNINNIQSTSNIQSSAQNVSSTNLTLVAGTYSTVATNTSTTDTSVGSNKSLASNMTNSPSRIATNYSAIASSSTGPNMSTGSNLSMMGSNMSLMGPNMSTGSNMSTPSENIDISSWEEPETDNFTSLPSTSQVPKSVTKICGQNICLDDSIFKRNGESDDDDFLSEDRNSLGSKSGSLSSKSDIGTKSDKMAAKIDSSGTRNDKVGSKIDNLRIRNDSLSINESDVNSHKQTVVVNDKQSDTTENSDRSTNITVIQVSNKDPPHTAIPVIGFETDVFDFNFKSTPRNPNYINIVNTEVNVQNTNEYGTVLTKNEPDYGHISLTTTVSLTGDVSVKSEDAKDVNVRSGNEGLYEKLCLASTSKEVTASPLPVRKLKSQEKMRKSSLPNLDALNSDPLYEYLFLSQNSNNNSETSSSKNVPNDVTTRTNDITTTTSHVATRTNDVTTTTNHVATRTLDVTTANVQSRVNDVATSSQNVTTSRNMTANNITTISTVDNNSRVHINTGSMLDSNVRVLRSNIERYHSQNAYDVSPRRENRIENGQKCNGKLEKIESVQPKPIWKRGLTELSLLTRLRGITQKRHDSPDRQHDRMASAVSSPVKVVHRSRPEVRADRSRRRSSSLSNGQSPPSLSIPPSLQPLRARQAAALRSEQRRGAAIVATCRTIHPPVFADYNKQVWVAWWGAQGARFSGRAGDRVCGVRGVMPRDSAHAKDLFTNAHTPTVDILFHRVPLGKIYVINKRDQESTGIKLDAECSITSVSVDSPAAAAGLPPPGKWAATELNNRPLQLHKVDPEEVNRLTLRGTEASVLIQPAALVKKLRAAIKGNKTLLGLR